MFNIAMDESGNTCNSEELVKGKSAPEVGNARKRKYFCVTCKGEKHPLSLNVRRESLFASKITNYTMRAWFSHHGGGGNGGDSKRDSPSGETAKHWQAKHIVSQHLGRYYCETSRCSGCDRHTKFERGTGACSKVEYVEKKEDGSKYIFDAVLLRGDGAKSAVSCVMEIWATHETGDTKREYCLQMGYTFCEFDAQSVVDAHEASVEGVCYKLENLKVRLFLCQDCLNARVARDAEVKRQQVLRRAIQDALHREQIKRQEADRAAYARRVHTEEEVRQEGLRRMTIERQLATERQLAIERHLAIQRHVRVEEQIRQLGLRHRTTERQPAINPLQAIERQQALHHENIQKREAAHDRNLKIQQDLYDEKLRQQQCGHVAYVEENIAHQAVHDEKIKRQRVEHEKENTKPEKGRGKTKKTKDAVQTPFPPGVADQEEERFTAFLIERRKHMEELDKATQSWKTRNFAAWSKKELWQQERDRELSFAVYRQGHPNPHPDFH